MALKMNNGLDIAELYNDAIRAAHAKAFDNTPTRLRVHQAAAVVRLTELKVLRDHHVLMWATVNDPQSVERFQAALAEGNELLESAANAYDYYQCNEFGIQIDGNVNTNSSIPFIEA